MKRGLWIVLTLAIATVVAAITGLLVLSAASERVVLEGDRSSLSSSVEPGESAIGGIGAIANESPWPVTLVGAGTPEGIFTSDVRVGIAREEGPDPEIEWIGDDSPVILHSGETASLWFAVTPRESDPAGFAALEIRYLDELDRSHTASAGIGFLAAPAGLPEGVASLDGDIDDVGYVTFMRALTAALATEDPEAVAPFLGGGATMDDAETFLRVQAGVDETYGYMTNETGVHTADVAFFATTSEDSAPTFEVSWSKNRWTAAPS